jgi:hypothetical protein
LDGLSRPGPADIEAHATAIAAPAFEHPKISVNANINAGFADRMGGG